MHKRKKMRIFKARTSGKGRLYNFPLLMYKIPMFPPFPTGRAAAVCAEIARRIVSGESEIVRTAETAESEERRGSGLTLGAAVCADGSGRRLVLATNSGTTRAIRLGTDEILGLPAEFVPPVVGADEIARALSGNDAEIHALTERINALKGRAETRNIMEEIGTLSDRRRRLCAESLARVHALYSFRCADGSVRSLAEICTERNRGRLPPTGTGDCCAPKLLDAAFSRGLTVESMSEAAFPSGEEIAPCDERCGIVLPAMLGLRIIYRDDDICAIDKQSGLLSVPGRTEKDSAETRFRRLFPRSPAQPAVHRLDMETSGIMLLAMNGESQRAMQRQFEGGKVRKEYVALLDGVLAKRGIPASGVMETFFRVDIENRPHQIWDREFGKKAVTEWKILGVERRGFPDGTTRNATRVLFMPRTGRTHQLRTASADEHGFGVPIIGDSLYGTKADGVRLMLHARKIEFDHPRTGERMTIEREEEF